jgi:outer membrane receptor protein involved in Fe transport
MRPAYLQYYDWGMRSNATYDFQINQFDRRLSTGGRYDQVLVNESSFELRAGGELRYDDIGPVGLDEYDAGSFVLTLSSNNIRETSVGVYTEAMWSWSVRLRFFAGLRGDYFNFDVAALSAGNFAGSEPDRQISPKAGLAYVAGKSLNSMAIGEEDFIPTMRVAS